MSYWISVGPKFHMTGVLIRREGTQRQKYREKARWWWSQRLQWCIYKPRNTKDCQQTPKARKRQGKMLFLRRLQRGHDFAKNLISDSIFYLPEPRENKFLVFKSPQFVLICYGSPRKQIQQEVLMLLVWGSEPENHGSRQKGQKAKYLSMQKYRRILVIKYFCEKGSSNLLSFLLGSVVDLCCFEVAPQHPDGASGKEPVCQCRRWKKRRFDPQVEKVPWRRA